MFHAAVEFLAAVGVYNRSASQVIKWSEEEIRDMADDYRTNPRSFVIGAGAGTGTRIVSRITANILRWK